VLHIIAILAISSIDAQLPPATVAEDRVKMADEAFWAAFNACDRARIAASLAPDIEFYHDKTGAMISRATVVRSLMDGPCGKKGLHVRRELVAGSLSYDPVPGFGAILTGRHRFYAQQGGQPERLDGEARFAIVWRDVKGRLLVYRVLSYAHGAASEQTALPPFEVPPTILQRYVGHYASQVGDIEVTFHDGRLHLASGGLSADLFAINATTFQAPGRSLKFEFVEADGKIDKVVVLENGATVTEGKRQASR